MNQRFERVKTHFRENKKTYLACGGTAIVAAVGTFLVVNGRKKIEIGDVETLINQSRSFMPRTTYNKIIASFEEKSTPSKPVRMLGVDGIERFFRSMSEASRQTGYSVSQISQAAHGKTPNLNGNVFELLEIVEDALEDVRE